MEFDKICLLFNMQPMSAVKEVPSFLSLTKYVFCYATYECSERGAKLGSQEGKGDAAEKTKQRRNSHEKSNLQMKP